MSSITRSPKHGPQDTQNWLHTSVQTFFATCNWDNQSIEVQAIKFAALTEVNSQLTLNLSVQEFFAAVNWDGASLNSSTPSPEDATVMAPKSDGRFTLTDFSDLF
jgi:hypothetical protein